MMRFRDGDDDSGIDGGGKEGEVFVHVDLADGDWNEFGSIQAWKYTAE